MSDEKEDCIATKMIRLFTQFPCAGTGDADFSVVLPSELSRRSYELVISSIEFRRKCMNQGFDNLLELLRLHFDGFQDMRAEEKNNEAGEVSDE
jgi:hypothetical protein